MVSEARAQTTSKTFVLIHGAWVGGWYWRRVSDLLEKKGHKVFSPTLTGLGERSHLLSKDINLDTHVTDIVNVIKWEGLNDISFVAHSYAGFPASVALDQIGDRVSSIVWLDALKPENGDKVVDLLSEARRASTLAAFEKGEISQKGPAAEFFLVNEKDRALVDEKQPRIRRAHSCSQSSCPAGASRSRRRRTFALLGSPVLVMTKHSRNVRPINHGPSLKRLFQATS